MVLAHLDHPALGRQQRVLERADQCVGPGEVGPRVGVRAFASAIDPALGIVFEIFSFTPDDTHGDGASRA
jgi:hypothetical protein